METYAPVIAGSVPSSLRPSVPPLNVMYALPLLCEMRPSVPPLNVMYALPLLCEMAFALIDPPFRNRRPALFTSLQSDSVSATSTVPPLMCT